MSDLPPVALFVYRRPDHTRLTVSALAACPEAPRTDLVVFADGPVDAEHRQPVDETRAVILGAAGFRSVRLVARPQNLGLFQNVVSGLAEMFAKHERVVVLEDDIQVLPDFLSYMSAALDHYQAIPHVHSITGYLYPAGFHWHDERDTFLFPRFCCWGWATWRDRWKQVDWSIPDRAAFLGGRESFRRFWQASNDLPEIMLDLIDRKNASWSILFNYRQVMNGGFCVYPTRARALNIGLDGSGTHAGEKEKFKVRLGGTHSESSRSALFSFADTYDKEAAEPLRRYFENGPRRRMKNLVRYGRFF